MKIGIMLRHYEQQEGGVKVYTKKVLPLLFSLGSQHQYVLIYQNRKLLGTYANYPNVAEVAAAMPGTVTPSMSGAARAAAVPARTSAKSALRLARSPNSMPCEFRRSGR